MRRVDADVLTFLIADVRGFTRFTQEQGDEAASQLARHFAAIVRGALPDFGGELVETRGDEALAVFGSARQALRASVGSDPVALAVGPDAIWVANSGDGTISRIDPDTNSVKTISVGHRPLGVAVADGLVWVTVRS
jgi:YVTN family beta-propeller protein